MNSLHRQPYPRGLRVHNKPTVLMKSFRPDIFEPVSSAPRRKRQRKNHATKLVKYVLAVLVTGFALMAILCFREGDFFGVMASVFGFWSMLVLLEHSISGGSL